jgi:O-antigen/teichoic acid export membrane protein
MPKKDLPISAMQAFAQSAGAKLLILAINAVTGIVSARILAPAGRGELSAMILWYSLLANGSTFGIPAALTYYLRRHPEKCSEITGSALVLSLAISLVASVVGVFCIPYWMPQYSTQTLLFARIFVCLTPVSAFFLAGRAALESQGQFGTSNLSQVIPPALTLAGLIVIAAARAFTPVNAALCYALTGIISLCLIARSLVRTLRPSLGHFLASAASLVSYGIRSYGIDLCSAMAFYVDQALVIRILKPNFMGIYVVALSLSRILNAFHGAVALVLFPRAVSRSPREILELTGRAFRMTTLVTVACGIGIMVAGPRLLTLLYGPSYSGAATVLRILVVEVILSGATQVISQAFMALGRPGVITGLQAFGLSLTVPLMLVLVPRFGLEGAAVALMLSSAARFGFVLASFSTFLNLPSPTLIPGRADLQYMNGVVRRRLRMLQPGMAAGWLDRLRQVTLS